MVFINRIFKPAAPMEEIQDQELVKTEYKYWRIRVFYSMFIGYIFFYLTRKSFTFAMPAMIADLHITKGELGILASAWSVSYGVSKFVSGLMGDKSNAKYFMSFGLFVTGLCNIFFGASSSLPVFALFWALNGWFQGFGWPACARLLTHWYSQSERGRWWSFWNMSHNIGGSVIPLATAVIAQYYGWRYAMIVPGAVSMLMSFVLLNRLTDTPQALGLPTIEKFRNDYPSEKAKKETQERELTVKEILFEYVFTNHFTWILAISYYFVYIIRFAVGDWTVLYLVETKGFTPLGAGGIVFWFDIGGMFGALAAGWASDKLFKGKRGPINTLFSLGVTIPLALFCFSPTQAPVLLSAILFLTGFFIFGPQMMIGMQAAELSHKKAAATASGFTGLVAYLGAATAGYPLGQITQAFGWKGFFMTLIISGFVSASILVFLWNVKSKEDRIFKRKPKTLAEELQKVANEESDFEIKTGIDPATG